ncbi:MAG: tyrosine--tRNA ligase [bacterium]|nr:tyrosine--tRNA ligase [bacterium]
MSLLNDLSQRKLLHDVSHQAELDASLSSRKVTFYCGFDPTADSLHVGSLLPLLIMKRFMKDGHKGIALLGTATGAIGDPSGRSSERNLLKPQQIEENRQGIEKQIRHILADDKNEITVVENNSWVAKLSAIEFLRDVGKHFSVNAMIQKESVKARLENREQGISYTEFSYMLLQAYDYYWLYHNYGCRLQIGGSDQWGNITAGMDLIRRKSGEQAEKSYGLTFPLLLSSSGEKFGKTAAGAVWLSADKTSPYQFYQYWINISDEDAALLLPKLSSLDIVQCSALCEEALAAPEKRLLQTKIAAELTTLVHGPSELDAAIRASQVFFGGSMDGLNHATLRDIFREVPSAEIPRSIFQPVAPLLDILTTCGAAKSRGEARRLIEGGGIYLNNQRINDVQHNVGIENFIDENILVIRSGKKKYYLLQLANS